LPAVIFCTARSRTCQGARDLIDLSAPNDNGYAPVIAAIAAHYGVDPARVAQAGGCSGANFITVAALVGAGDDVLVERPTYDPLDRRRAIDGREYQSLRSPRGQRLPH
jgi:aspartate/methionine/tyrosine aminotransferase